MFVRASVAATLERRPYSEPVVNSREPSATREQPTNSEPISDAHEPAVPEPSATRETPTNSKPISDARRPAVPVPGGRRKFLHQLGAGMGTVAATVVMADRVRADTQPPAVVLDPLSPYAPRSPKLPAKARSVIVLFMVGGPSATDTFDYKPTLQELNGKPICASSIRFRPIRTTMPLPVINGTRAMSAWERRVWVHG